MSRNPVINAIRLNDDVALTQALKRAEDVNAVDENGDLPLLVAVRYDNLWALKRLVSHGADVNKKDNIGNTPLMIAIRSHRTSMVKFLLENGARANIRDPFGRVAWDYVQDAKNADLADLLAQAQGRSGYASTIEEQRRLSEKLKGHKLAPRRAP